MKTTLSIIKNNIVWILLSVIILGLALVFDVYTAIKAIIVLASLILMWINPMYGIALYIVGMPYISDMNLLLLGIGVVGFFIISYIRKGRFEFDYTKIDILLLVFLVLIVINTVLSIDPKGSFRDFALHFVSISIIFVLIHNKSSRKDLYLISVAMVMVAAASSVYGIYQYITDVPMGSGWVDPSQNPNITTRVFATFENPNLLAEYLVMIFPVSLALVFYNRSIMKRFLFSMTTVLILISIGLTYSRGGWLGLAVGIFVFLLLLNRKAVFSLIPVGLLAIAFVPTSIIQRIMTIGDLQDTSIFYRFSLWEKSIDIIKDFWYSGIGIGYIPFQQIVPLYIKSMAPYHTHNTLLQLAIELGVIGLIVFMLLIFSTFRMGLKAISEDQSRFIKIFTIAYITSMIGILVHGLVEHIFFNPKIILMFWLMLGLLITHFRLNKKEQQEG